LAYPVSALGPGQRIALWVSGCPLNCAQCISPALRDAASGKDIAVELLAQRLLRLPAELDGLSLSGGEPFAQAAALARLLDLVLPQRPLWNVLAFSGYPLASLQKDPAARDLLARLDILIDGPYLPHRPAIHPLAASANQRVHYLSQRGQALQAQCEALPFDAANLGVGGETRLIGIISVPARARLHRQLGLEKVRI
jgi:anaerobic ribonucleoside-triphosphate reductase activating protein